MQSAVLIQARGPGRLLVSGASRIPLGFSDVCEKFGLHAPFCLMGAEFSICLQYMGGYVHANRGFCASARVWWLS